MKYIELAFEKKELRGVLNKEFENLKHFELIDKVPKESLKEPETLEEYLPQPSPMGATPEQILLLRDFIFALVVSGSYDLMKFGLMKAIDAAREVIKENHPEGIKIFTGGWSGTFWKRVTNYEITFTLPYSTTAQSIEVIARDIKELDRALKKFLNRTKGKIKRSSYEFKYLEGRWIFKIK